MEKRLLVYGFVATFFLSSVLFAEEGELNLDEAIAQGTYYLSETQREIDRLKVLNSNVNVHADVVPFVCNGRLTLVSGTAVPGTNQVGKNIIYFTPYQGSNITLFSGAIWQNFSFSEISITLAGLTIGKNYDVFIYNNAGTVTLELSTAWTSNTVRANALVLQNGVYVKSGATTRLYLGTFRATAATTTEDSTTNRFLWNFFNRRRRVMSVNDATANWTYNVAAWRSANNNAADRLQYVTGVNDTLLQAIVLVPTAGTANANFPLSVGIGVDVTNANSAQVAWGYASSTVGTGTSLTEYRGYPGLGYHFLQWIEYGNAAGTPRFYSNSNFFKGGVFGYLEN